MIITAILNLPCITLPAEAAAKAKEAEAEGEGDAAAPEKKLSKSGPLGVPSKPLASILKGSLKEDTVPSQADVWLYWQEDEHACLSDTSNKPLDRVKGIVGFL